MQAVAVHPATREVALIDHPEPRLESPTQVKLRILEVGVCGTDREIAHFQYGTPPAGSEWLVIGHESLGEVVEVGPDVQGLAPGDLVVPMVRRPCPHPTCLACTAGRQDFCYTGDFTERGIKGRHGFMTELVVDEARYMNPVPRALRDTAVLVEPLTIAEKALIQLWQVQERLPWACPVVPGQAPGHCHTAIVLGSGPVGLLGALALRAADFDVHVFSRAAAPNPASELLAQVGAHYVSAADEPIAALAQRLGNVDLVYEATGAAQIAFDTLAVMGANSVFIFTGVPGRRGPITIDADGLMRDLVLKNQMVFGTVNASREAFAAAIRDLGVFEHKWPGVVRRLVTAHWPVTAFRDLLLSDPAGIKNVVSLAA
ncbi:MAG: glucose 1-dehydrogenase [bacterium]|nr:glucose 1-dehydrogenase [bacterium]